MVTDKPFMKKYFNFSRNSNARIRIITQRQRNINMNQTHLKIIQGIKQYLTKLRDLTFKYQN